MSTQLLSVIIVEDDMNIRSCLKNLINTANCGYIVVAEADNGKSGAVLAKKMQPDLIITDIFMPIMTGFEMMEELADYSFEYLVLSGYDDFQYLKSAINFGVADYLLKPISETELASALKKIRKKYADKKIAFNYDKLSYIRLHYIHELLKDRSNEIDSQVFLNFISAKHDYFAVVYVELSAINTEQFLKRFISSDTDVEFIPYSDTAVFILYNSNQAYSAHTLYRTYNSYYPNQFEYIGICVTDSRQSIIKCLLTAFRQVDLQHLLHEQHFYEDFIPDNTVDVNILYDNFKTLYAYIDDNDLHNAENMLDTLFSNAFFYNNYSKFKSLITKFLFHLENKYTNVFDSVSNDMDINIHEFIYMSDLKNYIQGIVRQVITFNLHDEKKYSKATRDAITLIHQEYQTITTEKAAERLFISPSYLMYLFKHDTNETFNNFLINYRISVACQLLLAGKKVYEVSNEIGYKSTKFFSTLFKEKTGFTPSEYVKHNN